MPSSCSRSSSSLPLSSPHSPNSQPDTCANATPLTIDGISGNVSATVKEAFLKPGMIFPTLGRDGKYRVLGFAMETVFQRVVVTEINSHHYESKYEFNSDIEARMGDKSGTAAKNRMESVTLVCEVDVLPGGLSEILFSFFPLR